MIENLLIFMNNYPIIFALGVIAITLAIIEIVMAMLMGFNLSSNIEVFLPDVDIDADADTFFVSWLGFGKVPFAITLYILFLSMFAISYLISSMYAFNQILMFLISLIISLIFVKMINSKLALLFIDNTNSVSVKESLNFFAPALLLNSDILSVIVFFEDLKSFKYLILKLKKNFFFSLILSA